MSFSSLGLNKLLLQAIEESGYTKPRPVQAKAIPPILLGRDVIASAQTGTGKTAAFTLPLLHRLAEHSGSGPGIRALVLTPTRELAAQVAENLATYGKHLSITSCVVVGGVKIGPQISRLKKSCDVVIATPGRFLDLLNQGVCQLSSLEILVLDEADRMLDMGFIRDIRKIIASMPAKRQSLLFSATFSNEIKVLAKTFLNNPVNVEVAAQNATADRVTQVVHPVDKAKKRSLLSYMIGSKNWKQVLVFTRTKHGANRLVKQLIEDGLTAAAIHGNKSQGARTKALASFKRGDVRVLVATDIAARGIDIDALPYVVNYELPNVPEDYVHRIGRTGRSDYAGLAVSLVCVDELPFLRDIEKLLKRRLTQEVVPDFEVDTRIAAEPIILGGQKRGRSSHGGSQSRNRRSSSDADSGSRRRSGSGQGPRSHDSGDHGSDGEGRSDDRRRSGSGQGPRSHGSSDRRSDGEGRSDDRRRSGSGQGSRSHASSDRRSDGEGRRNGSAQGSRSHGSSDRRSDGEGRRSGSAQGARSHGSSDRRSDGEGRRSGSAQGSRSHSSSDRRSDGEGRRSASGQRRSGATRTRSH